ncbi:hypothetical protein ACFL0V_07175 [Nanoarchaeota archaeon]
MKKRKPKVGFDGISFFVGRWKCRRCRYIMLIILAVILMLMVRGPITGMFVVGTVLQEHEQQLDWSIRTDGAVTWTMENPPEEIVLRGVKLSGKVIGSTDVKVYLERSDGERLLILDGDELNEGLNRVTAMMVGVPEDQEVTIVEGAGGTNESLVIDVDLVYQTGTQWDADDDGVALSEGDAVDLAIGGTEFNWDVDESKLCTKWTIANELYDTMKCFGSVECCALLGVAPEEGAWDEAFYVYEGRFGATADNVVGAQVVYVDQSLETGDVHFDSAFSDIASLPVRFEEAVVVEFEAVCEETCILPDGFDVQSYDIVYELGPGSAVDIDSVTYYLEEDGEAVEEVEVDVQLVDSNGKVMPARVEFLDGFGNVEVEYDVEVESVSKEKKDKKDKKGGDEALGALAQPTVKKEKKKVRIIPENDTLPIQKIEFADLAVNETLALRFEEVVGENKLDQYMQMYAIDPEALNFTNATVTVTAKGTELYKCKDWNFENQSCYGNWGLFKTGLVPGENYTFILTPDDPGFGEVNESGNLEIYRIQPLTIENDQIMNVGVVVYNPNAFDVVISDVKDVWSIDKVIKGQSA